MFFFYCNASILFQVQQSLLYQVQQGLLYQVQQGLPNWPINYKNAIGLRASAALARLEMCVWDVRWAQIQKQYGLIMKLIFQVCG